MSVLLFKHFYTRKTSIDLHLRQDTPKTSKRLTNFVSKFDLAFINSMSDIFTMQAVFLAHTKETAKRS